MNDVIKWVTTKEKHDKIPRIDSALLSKYVDYGYAIDQHDCDLFMVTRIKSSRIVTATSITTAHLVINVAMSIEKKEDLSELYPSLRESIIDKALKLVGKIDVIYNGKDGDKVRRKCRK